MTHPPDPLLERAERRWAELASEQPDLAASIDVQRRLVSRSIEALRRLEARPEADIGFPRAYLTAKLSRGAPALAGETIPPAADLLGPLLGEFADTLAEAGGGDPARHVRQALDAGRIEPTSWLVACLTRDRMRVLRGATQMGLAPDLIWLIGELASAPLAHLLSRSILETLERGSASDGTSLASWDRGQCPACGSWPALAERSVDDVQPTLRCAYCAAGWRIAERRCVHCGARNDALEERTPFEARPDRRIELCGRCKGYLKIVDVDEPLVFPLASVEDLATASLDVVASEAGHRRPSLPDGPAAAEPGDPNGSGSTTDDTPAV